METVPEISILIANYNNGKYFKDCYNSLINQTEKNWEAIIIDDTSTDDSLQIIRKLTEGDSRFKVFENEQNMGYQKTIAKGIELSKAPIFARLDPDDALYPEAISMSIKAHQENPEVGLVYTNFTNCDDQLTPQKHHTAKQVNDFGPDFYNFKGEISHFASFKKKIYEKTSGIDIKNKRAEDKDIYMKMCEVGPVKHIDIPLYFYRRHSQGASTFSNYAKAYFWHWVAIIKMAERRDINVEDLFIEEIKRVFVIPKVKTFENSFSFFFFRIENKIRNLFNGRK